MIINAFMKRLMLFAQIGLFFLLVSCRSNNALGYDINAKGYDITVKIRNFKDTVAYLGYNFGDQKFVKDTSKVFNGNTLHFKNDTTVLPQGVYFIYSPSVYFEIIVNEPKISIETDTTDFVGDMKVLVSNENKIFNEFQKFMSSKQQESSALSSQADSLQKIKDTVALAGLREKMTQISEEVKSYQNKVMEKNPGTFVAKLIGAMQKPVVPDPPKDSNGNPVSKDWQFYYYKDHFFDHFNLADSGLLRSPVYQPKIDEYMDKLTLQEPDSIQAAADFLLSKAEPNKEVYRYLLVKLTNKYETSNIMGMERVFVYLAENYYLKGKAYWADTALIHKFEKRVTELKPNLIGNIAPDMQLVDTLMRPVRLSNLHNRFTILYFYDPDCGHCKKTTPVLYDLYTKSLKDKGVAVWAACIVTDVKKWKAFIRNDHLKGWINVADPNLHDNFRAEYDIKSTPTIYILNSKREIIAKRLGVEQIEDFINRMIDFEDKKTKS